MQHVPDSESNQSVRNEQGVMSDSRSSEEYEPMRGCPEMSAHEPLQIIKGQKAGFLNLRHHLTLIPGVMPVNWTSEAELGLLILFVCAAAGSTHRQEFSRHRRTKISKKRIKNLVRAGMQDNANQTRAGLRQVQHAQVNEQLPVPRKNSVEFLELCSN